MCEVRILSNRALPLEENMTETQEKKTIMMISDHPLAPSGVGTQTKYVIDALIKTGRYKFVCLGGAVSHPNYDVQKIDLLRS